MKNHRLKPVPPEIPLRKRRKNYNQYDADSHPTSITYSSTGGGTLGNLTYGYDNDGRVNSLGGSLAAVNLPAAMPTATYDNGNQLATWNGTPATTDNNGNLLSDPSLNATYIWNERNQLSSATVGGVVSSFTYDALGRRVAQTAGSLTTQYVYDLLNVAQEQFSTGGVGDMLPGLGLDQNFSRVDSSGTSAVLPDMLGSTLGLVNSSGTIGTGYAYGPFGQTTTNGTTSTNPFEYTGREMDSTGLYFLRARYYNPVLQRFISQDPIGLSGGQINLYAYAFNSPSNFGDPLGLKSGSSGGGGGGGYQHWSWDSKNQMWNITAPGTVFEGTIGFAGMYYAGVNSGATVTITATPTATPTTGRGIDVPFVQAGPGDDQSAINFMNLLIQFYNDYQKGLFSSTPTPTPTPSPGVTAPSAPSP
jgi:RHS repeat-associated protein